MRVCFVVGEIFHWGVHGGYGALTRAIGRELVKRKVEVYVVMPQSSVDQRRIETLDGMIVLSVPSKDRYFSLVPSVRSRSFLKLCEADIYHSEEPSVATYIATKVNPKKRHIITLQDPRDMNDMKIQLASAHPERNFLMKWLVYKKYKTEGFLIKKALHRTAAVFSQAKYIIPKAAKMYSLKKAITFLPNPVEIRQRKMRKAESPTVCFLARWDPLKRIEIFFDLAKKFPSVKFIAMGKAHDIERDHSLRRKYSTLPNLEMPGFVSEQKKFEILDKSWIMINTSLRECLPVAFLEACAHKCAILSCNNPDNFASNFGFYVRNGDFSAGLKNLIEDMQWKEKGERGFKYVKEVHELDKVIDQHIDVYNKLLSD